MSAHCTMNDDERQNIRKILQSDLSLSEKEKRLVHMMERLAEEVLDNYRSSRIFSIG